MFCNTFGMAPPDVSDTLQVYTEPIEPKTGTGKATFLWLRAQRKVFSSIRFSRALQDSNPFNYCC